jgi:hypothetical protein
MLNINVKSEEPLKIYKTSSGSSPGVDMSIYVKKSPRDFSPQLFFMKHNSLGP